jgi:hypothetical protein
MIHAHTENRPKPWLATVDDAIGQGHQAGDRQQHTDQVDLSGTRVTRLRHQDGDRKQTEQHDGHVDQEDRPPPEVFEQEPAEQRADGNGQTDRAGPDADRLAALPRVEDVGNDGKRHGHDGRGAEAHERARRDELVGVLRVRGQHRGEAEQDQAGEQHPLATPAVAEDAEAEEQAGED